MQEGGHSLRVKLTTDLTKYDSRCVLGSEGITLPNIKLSKFGGLDSFVAVEFDNGARMDIAENSLDYIEDKEELCGICLGDATICDGC